MDRVYYKPPDAWCGDFIPFFKDGTWRLFYLKDWRNKETHGEGTPWYQVSTSDFVRYTDHGEMIPRGTAEEQDLYVYTGSAVEGEGRYHIFYTGHNPHFPAKGRPRQAIMHAVSDDLLSWRKIPAHTFYAKADVYEPDDWRDPFVFWNGEAGEYWMLLAARLKTGPSRRRGCTALCVSKDLESWTVRDPFWSPSLYFTHECPDLFRIGAWWYLVFSTFSEKHVTHYRMARSLTGPWTAPENDAFDGRAFYAAKTWTDGRNRYAFAWNPSRMGEKDDGRWQWGGNLAVHEVVQEGDGSLSVRVPAAVEGHFSRSATPSFTPACGSWKAVGQRLSADAADGFACAVAGGMPEECLIRASLSFDPTVRSCGLMLRADGDLEAAYYVRLEPRRGRVVFDMWPRPGDLPYQAEIERPVDLGCGKRHELKVFVCGTVCEVYVDGKVAMSARLYDRRPGQWGLFVTEGTAEFSGITVSTPS